MWSREEARRVRYPTVRALAEHLRRALADGPPAPWFGAQLFLLAAYFAVRGARWESLPVVACAALLLPGATRRAAAAIALGFYAWRIAKSPFVVPNHEFVEAAVLAILAIAPTRGEPGRALFRRSLMAMTVLLVLLSGVQKVAHGFYLRGDFFSVSAAQPESKFAAALRPLLSEPGRAELDAFHAAFEAHVRAAVPGVLDVPPPRPPTLARASALACAATLLAELVLPIFLLPRRTRRLAAIELALFFAAVIAVSREYVFGALLAILLLPFFARPPLGPSGGVSRAGPPGRAPVLGCAALLLAFATWPFVHGALVRQLDLAPWKLGGFGMYAVPARLGTVVVETRAQGEGHWRPRPPRDEAEESFYYRRDFALRSAPFAPAPARELAERARATAPGGGDLAVRVRSLSMRYDRAANRFRLDERVYDLTRTRP